MLKNKWVLFVLNILFSLILFLILANEPNILQYINTLFYLCFFYILLFLIQYTMKSGFFDGITFGFRRFNHIVFKRNDYLEEWRDKPLPSEKINHSSYRIIMFQGVSLILVLIMLIFMYYFLL